MLNTVALFNRLFDVPREHVSSTIAIKATSNTFGVVGSTAYIDTRSTTGFLQHQKVYGPALGGSVSLDDCWKGLELPNGGRRRSLDSVQKTRGEDKGHLRSQSVQDSLAGDVLRKVRLLLICWRKVQNSPGNQQHQLEESLCLKRHDSTAISFTLSNPLKYGDLR